MENESKLRYSIEETPWYFGAYLNMARHNMFLLINHLTEKFKYLDFTTLTNDADIVKENILSTVFNTDISKYELERFKVYRYIVKRHYLPFTKIFHEKYGHELDTNPNVDYKKLHLFLNSVFKLLNDFRNSYTHYLSIDANGHKIDERKQEVSSDIKDILLYLFKQAPDFSLIRFDQKFENKHFTHISLYKLFEKDSTKLTEQGFYFFINLFLERANAIKFLKKISGFKNETIPVFKATVQSFSAYSIKIPDNRLDTDDVKNALLLDMLNELQKCPKELFHHLNDKDRRVFEPILEEQSKNNILLNSIDYNNIPDKDIDSILSEMFTLKRNSNRFPYFALRFIDEFDLFPNIRFQINIGKLQIKQYEKKILGLSHNRRILKPIKLFGKLSDFENKEVNILKNFKKENEEQIYFDQFAPHYNIENNKIPFYLSSNDSKNTNNSQSTLNNKEDIVLTKKPSGFISINDLPKLALLAIFQKNTTETYITDFIKKNSSFILDFDQLENIKKKLLLEPESFTKRINNDKLLLTNTGKIEFLNNVIEERLLKKYDINEDNLNNWDNKNIKNRKDKEYINQIRYLTYLSNRKAELQKNLPQNILVNQLPEQVINYLLNIVSISSHKKIHRKIQSSSKDCKIRLTQIKNKPTKEDNPNLKTGELATFLARDIINMVINKDVKQKITSPYYNKLQNNIAFFSINKTEIIELLTNLNLFDTNKGHVFLTKNLISESESIIDFYKNYLEKKNKWITDNLFTKGKNGGYYIPERKRIPYSYLKYKNNIIDFDFNTWLEHKKTMPIDLPSSLFTAGIEKILAEKLYASKIKFDKDSKFSIRLAKYLRTATQPFYNFKRVYKINSSNKEIDVKNLDNKTLKARYGKKVESNEKLIRFIQTQDRVIKILCEYILNNNSNNVEEDILNLNDITPYSEKSPLNKPVQFKQILIKDHLTIIAKDTPEQIEEIKTYNELTNESEKLDFKGQKGYEWTRKDYGRFKSMFKDRRITNLSDYFSFKEVGFDFLKYQISEYNRYREKIFKLTFDFEKSLSSKAFDELVLLEMTKRKEKKKQFNEVQFNEFLIHLKKNNHLNSTEIDLLAEIRNGFSHSEFPKYKVAFELGIEKISEEVLFEFEQKKRKEGEVEKLNISISKKIYDQYFKIINSVLSKI